MLALEQMLTQLGYEVLCLHDELDRNNRLFPTRDNVEARLIELCRAVQPDDLIWVHFACHGTRVEKQGNKKEPVLITQDTQLTLLKQRALSVAEVEQHMRNSSAGKLVLTLDACHSGVDIGRDLTDPEFIKNVYELAEGFALIAASTAEQTAREWNQHGVFTYYLLEGLNGKADRNGKNMVTVDDLKNHVLDALRRWNVKHGGMQEPTARTEGLGDLIEAGSIILIELKKIDLFEERNIFLSWLVNDFWQGITHKLPLICQSKDIDEVKFIIVINSNDDILEECLDQSFFCHNECFNMSKIFSIFLKNWTEEEIQVWLKKHPGLNKRKSIQIAKSIYKSSNEGIPRACFQILQQYPKGCGYTY